MPRMATMRSVQRSMTEEPREEFCPRCERVTEATLLSKKESLTVLGEVVEYTARIYRCGICGEEFATPHLEEQNFKRAYDLYRKRHNLVTSREIKAIRETYGLSQRSFARFLRWGVVTIHRYEAGAIQDIAHNQTLVLIKDNAQNARKIFELNRNNLSDRESRKVEERITRLIDQDGNNKSTSLESLIRGNASETEPTIESGYKAFDAGKLENLILHILRSLKGTFKTKLNKLLWYCDFSHFKNHGMSITGTRYQHLPYGPVPDNYDLYLWTLSRDKKIESQEIIFEDKSGEFFRAVNQEDLSSFTKEELATIKYVMKKLGTLNAGQISEKSHEETGYKKTRQSRVISYKFAADLSI